VSKHGYYRACVIFDIAGNNCRLIAKIDYMAQIVAVRKALTHAEYDDHVGSPQNTTKFIVQDDQTWNTFDHLGQQKAEAISASAFQLA
jgi:hypothetical protein